MNRYLVKFTSAKGEHEEEVFAWRFEREDNIAMFYDRTGEIIAIFVGFSQVRKLPDKDDSQA